MIVLWVLMGWFVMSVPLGLMAAAFCRGTDAVPFATAVTKPTAGTAARRAGAEPRTLAA